MSPRQSRVVTACQQLLALGVVLAVLTPAAAVLSLDVVGQVPGTSRQSAPPSVAPASPHRDDQARGQQGSTQPVADPAPSVPPTATVPTAPVEAEVTEVALTNESGAAADDQVTQPGTESETDGSREPGGAEPRERAGGAAVPAPTQVVSEPQPVDSFGTVGVTWSSEEALEEDEITLRVRTRTDGTWSDWNALEYHDEHAPDPDSLEAVRARPGSEPTVLGSVDAVQVSATAPAGLPSDLSLAVIEPGEAAVTETEGPEIAVGPDGASTSDAGWSTEAAAPSDGSDGAIALRATVEAPRPTIFSRAQWGADERMRDGSPSYGTIGAAFVHHTVNGNDYTRSEVPGILRSIYAYHTRSRGWSDIGYNFLVDKFGRIWEGRYGGVARPVIGAHTLGYNDDAFAMSAIGNFDVVRPTDAMLKAYGSLFAWKLGLHKVRADDMSQYLDGDRFAAINGHRDAGSTACPGRYLYARLDTIRTYAQAAQDADAPVPEPEPEPTEPAPTVPTVTPTRPDSDLAGTAFPDLVVRRAADGRGLVLPTGGLTRFTRPETIAERGWGRRSVTTTPDVTGDAIVDLLVVDREGRLEVRPGLRGGGFGATVRRVRAFREHTMPVGAGDVNGDGLNDVVGQRAGRLVTFIRNERGGFRARERDVSVSGFTRLSAAGDVTSDGITDLWGRDAEGRLVLLTGTGRGAFAAPTAVAGDWSGYGWFAGGADHTRDGRPDLLALRSNGALMVLPSRGDGTLAPALGPVRYASGLVKAVGAGQLTGGPTADLLAVNDAGALVVVPSTGTFDLGQPIDTGRSFSTGNLLINAGDFDGDGHGDVLMRRHLGPLMLFRGDGAGRLAAPVRIGGRWFRRFSNLRVTGDVTGDQRPDVIGVRGDGVILLWPGRGAQTVGTGYEVKVADEDPTASFDSTGYGWRIRVSDLRRRGPADLVVSNSDTGGLYRVNGTRSGVTGPRYLGELRGYDLGG